MKTLLYLMGIVLITFLIFYYGEPLHMGYTKNTESSSLGKLLHSNGFNFAVKKVESSPFGGINLFVYAQNTSNKPLAFYSTELNHNETQSYDNFYLFVKKEPNYTYIVRQAADAFTVSRPAIKVNPDEYKREVYTCDIQPEEFNKENYYLVITKDKSGEDEIARISLN